MTEGRIRPEYDLSSSSHPFARYRSDGDWADGVRPAHIIETVEDVKYALREAETGRPQIACGFCGQRRKIRTQDEGEHWFRSHTCEGEGVDIDAWLAQSPTSATTSNGQSAHATTSTGNKPR